ncbi:hypothetical protein AMECASPLE_025458, partial [Ameca splendens]
ALVPCFALLVSSLSSFILKSDDLNHLSVTGKDFATAVKDTTKRTNSSFLPPTKAEGYKPPLILFTLMFF